jgi:transposase-like protein
MTDDEICGYEKGTDGEPCEFSPSYPDGRCGHHTEHKEPEDKGRPTKLNKQRQEQIASAIENGRSITCAARRAGVSRNAVFSWIQKGEDQEEGVYAEFHDRITRAKGEGEEFYMNLALQLAKENGDHRFIASLMKQRYPDSWGETETGVEADKVEIVMQGDSKQYEPTIE